MASLNAGKRKREDVRTRVPAPLLLIRRGLVPIFVVSALMRHWARDLIGKPLRRAIELVKICAEETVQLPGKRTVF